MLNCNLVGYFSCYSDKTYDESAHEDFEEKPYTLENKAVLKYQTYTYGAAIRHKNSGTLSK